MNPGYVVAIILIATGGIFGFLAVVPNPLVGQCSLRSNGTCPQPLTNTPVTLTLSSFCSVASCQQLPSASPGTYTATTDAFGNIQVPLTSVAFGVGTGYQNCNGQTVTGQFLLAPGYNIVGGGLSFGPVFTGNSQAVCPGSALTTGVLTLGTTINVPTGTNQYVLVTFTGNPTLTTTTSTTSTSSTTCCTSSSSSSSVTTASSGGGQTTITSTTTTVTSSGTTSTQVVYSTQSSGPPLTQMMAIEAAIGFVVVGGVVGVASRKQREGA